MAIKLTATQRVMLSAAAQREDRCIAPPEKLKGAAATKVSAKLIEAGLVGEIKAKPGMPIWRRDEEGQPFALKLTAAGRKAIAVDNDMQGEPSPPIARGSRSTTTRAPSSDHVAASPEGSAAAPRPGSKLALVIGMLQRAEGATIDDLTGATGWLSHTTRAAITGLRKRGYSVTRDRSEAGVSAYRIQGAPAVVAPRRDEVGAGTDLRGRKSKAKQAA
jgi:Protein of unknown function (DUF3489)